MATATAHFGVSEQTLYNWRSTVGVPPSRVEWVRGRMAEFEKLESAAPLPDRLTLEATPDQFDDWNRAALAQGKILRQWAADALDDAAAEPVKKPIRYSDRPGLPSASFNDQP